MAGSVDERRVCVESGFSARSVSLVFSFSSDVDCFMARLVLEFTSDSASGTGSAPFSSRSAGRRGSDARGSTVMKLLSAFPLAGSGFTSELKYDAMIGTSLPAPLLSTERTETLELFSEVLGVTSCVGSTVRIRIGGGWSSSSLPREGMIGGG